MAEQVECKGALEESKLKKLTVVVSLSAAGVAIVIWVVWVFAAGGASIKDIPLISVFSLSIAVAVFVAVWALGGMLRWVLRKVNGGGTET